MNLFVERLKELRKTERISQQKLAKILNVSPNCISSWERGKGEPNLDIIIAIAKYFDVTCGYLLGVEDYWVATTTLAFLLSKGTSNVYLKLTTLNLSSPLIKGRAMYFSKQHSVLFLHCEMSERICPARTVPETTVALTVVEKRCLLTQTDEGCVSFTLFEI